MVLVQAKAGLRTLQDLAELQCPRGRQGWVMRDRWEGVLPLPDRSKHGLKNHLSPWFLQSISEALFIRRIFTNDSLKQSPP